MKELDVQSGEMMTGEQWERYESCFQAGEDAPGRRALDLFLVASWVELGTISFPVTSSPYNYFLELNHGGHRQAEKEI